jgi:hypothetical protein
MAGTAIDDQTFRLKVHLKQSGHLPVLCPLVLLLDLSLRVRSNIRAYQTRSTWNTDLLLRSEIVHNVEDLPDLLGRFTPDHIGDSFASNVPMK